ncbi:OmpA family protein [Undibacterium sp. Ji22W]|uniref:OmpA family protein n=1 Tax=Undibacterium sp. Ji22W TaxID=3413038 RepID=UPI003BF0E2E8
MKTSLTRVMTPIAIAISVLLGACSTTPKTTALLDQTRSDFMMAQNNPAVGTYAPLEMKQASEALAVANESALNKDSEQKIDSLAYLAKQKIATTQEVAKQKSAEADVQNSNKQRDQLRLDQRTQEANQSKIAADQAKLAADQAKLNAEQSKQATKVAQNETMEAQRLAQEAQAKTAKLEAQLAELAAKKTERGIVITFGDVLFDTNQSRLSPEGMRIAQKLADVLQQNPQRMALAEGFTDSVGTNAHNQALSERRSEAVRNALQGMGVSRDRVSSRGYGESFPVAGNQTADERRLNRRVEIILSDDSGKIAPR